MRDFVQWLAGWTNWIFLVPLTTGMLFVLAEVALGSLSDFVSVDVDIDVDVDADVDVDVDVDADADADVGEIGLLGWLGVGKVPITLLGEIFALSFGALGLLINAIVFELGLPNGVFFPVSLFVAGAGAVLSTRLLGGIVSELMPADATTTRTATEFVGSVGTAASRIDGRTGQVRIDASEGRPMTVLNTRSIESTETPIPRGTRVLVVRYDADDRVYAVRPIPRVEV